MHNALEINFWGVRGSLPVANKHVVKYGGNTSCIEVTADNGTHLVFDGGSGIYFLGKAYLKHGLPEHFAIFITHAHWDHIQGLPFFAPAYVPNNKITLHGCDQGTLAFSDILKRQMQSPYFPVKLGTWPSNTVIKSIGETEIEINGVLVRSAYVEHPGMTLGYRLEYKDTRVAYLPDNEPFAQFSRDKVFSDAKPVSGDQDIEMIFLEDQKRKLLTLIDSADVLIHDSQYTPEEYASKIGWGHSSYEIAVHVALLGSVKHLVLFHHDPARSDDAIASILGRTSALIKEKGCGLQVSAASENVPIKIQQHPA